MLLLLNCNNDNVTDGLIIQGSAKVQSVYCQANFLILHDAGISRIFIYFMNMF